LTAGNGGWEEVRVTVSDLVAPTGQMRLRFSATDGPLVDDYVEAAIDDILVERLLCSNQDADVDDSGGVDLGDYAAIQACFTGAGPCTCLPTLYDSSGQSECIRTDLDLDGDVDGADYQIYHTGLTE
jgi:hypothetical protein